MHDRTKTLLDQILLKYEYDPTCLNPRYLLQILRAIQSEQSFIGEADVAWLSTALKTPKAKIFALIDFYRFLHLSPRGEYDVYFSNSITDQMLGSLDYTKQLCEKLGVKLGLSRADGRVTVEQTSCTGLCEQGPALLVNGLAISQLDANRIAKIAELIEQQTPPHQWPTAWFEINDNIQQFGPLLMSSPDDGAAIHKSLTLGPDKTLAILEASGLRGCGGAGFATHKKWAFCRNTASQQRFVVCNADEGEPGTFKDRVLLNTYLSHLLEGMTACAVTIGATKGFIYLRHEYEFLREKIEATLQQRRENKLLGKNILDHDGIDFDIEVYMGAGAYVCGEESALIESLEGKRGIPRIRPPFPVTHGYLQQPTVVNNVETFCYAGSIIAKGRSFFSSPGWKLLSISGDCKKPGIYEIVLGTSVTDILSMCEASDTQAIQVGGAGGTLITPNEFDRKISFEDLNTGGSFIVFNQSRDMLETAVNFTHFFAHESCGFCTPCRVGTKLMSQMADKVAAGHGARLDIEQIKQLNHLMTQTSHCGLGQRAAVPLLETLQKIPHSFNQRMTDDEFQPSFDVEAAIQRAKNIITEQEATK